MRTAKLSLRFISQSMMLAVLLMMVTLQGRAADIKWNTYSDAAFQKAKNENKQVLLYGYTKRCPYCARMNRYTFVSSGIVNLVNKKYIAVKVDTAEHPDAAEKYGMYIVPTILILSADGNILDSIYGYQEPSELAAKL